MADVDHEELAARYGTPLYIYDLDRLDHAAEALRTVLPGSATLFYSVKANPHPLIVERLLRTGCGLEISSSGEMQTALEAGATGPELLYTGPAKTSDELAHAIDGGAHRFSVESFRELRRVGAVAEKLYTDVSVLVRVNGRGSRGGAGLRMTGTASQFGIDADSLIAEWSHRPVSERVRIAGLHLFPISNARDEAHLIAQLDASVDTAAEICDACGMDPELLDLGGGFGAAFAMPGQRPEYPTFGPQAEGRLDVAFPGWRTDQPRIAFESGRYLAADCGTLLSMVVDVKVSRGRTYAVLDAGINVLGGMTGLGRLLPMRAQPQNLTGGPESALVSLAGPTCTPLDVLGQDVHLPDVRPGTVLAIPNVGAYGLSASLLGFLSRPVADELVVAGDQVVQHSRWELRRSVQGERGGTGTAG